MTHFLKYIKFNDDSRLLMSNKKKTIEIGFRFRYDKSFESFFARDCPFEIALFLSKKVALKFRDYFHFFMTVLSDTFSVPYDKKIIIILRWARG